VLVAVQVGVDIFADEIANMCHLEVPFLLFLFHRCCSIMVDDAALTL
jgi:hypothetical protein